MSESSSKEQMPVDKIKATIWFRVFEFFFMASIGVSLYFICTLNYVAIAFIFVIVYLQTLVKDRYDPYINLIANKLEIPRFFKMTRYYEEKIPEH